MPWRYYQKWATDTRVELAIPLCFGDATEQGGLPGHRHGASVFQAPLARTPKPQPFRVQLRAIFSEAAGTRSSDLRWRGETGGRSAPSSNWSMGAAAVEDAHVHDEKFTVKGILEATGTPNDRTVFVHIDGFFMLAGHENPLGEAIKRVPVLQ